MPDVGIIFFNPCQVRLKAVAIEFLLQRAVVVVDRKAGTTIRIDETIVDSLLERICECGQRKSAPGDVSRYLARLYAVDAAEQEHVPVVRDLSDISGEFVVELRIQNGIVLEDQDAPGTRRPGGFHDGDVATQAAIRSRLYAPMRGYLEL
jgi:hypothetical protein